MQQHDCLELQRKARRSGRLRPNALLLLAEICDFHGCEKGCIAENNTFAENLGATVRSIRNWLSELKEHGLIAEAQQGPNRLLIPRVPGWMQEKDDSTAENSFREDSQFSGNDVPEQKENSTEGGKDFPPQRDNNPEGMRDSAPAHGGEAASFSELVATWRGIEATPHLRQRHEKTFQQWGKEGVIDDLNTFREVLEEDAKEVRDKDCGLSLSVTRQNYEEETSVLSAKRQDDPDWSVIDGEPAFKGVPISQIGPQNVYDERKDGSRRPEPEVSAA